MVLREKAKAEVADFHSSLAGIFQRKRNQESKKDVWIKGRPLMSPAQKPFFFFKHKTQRQRIQGPQEQASEGEQEWRK